MGLFIFYAAYPTGVLCLRDLEMFRSPFGATPFILIALKGWSENGSWPLMFDTENHNSSSNFEDWKTAKGLTDQRKDFDDPVGQFVIEFWRLKSRKRSDGPWQEKSYGWDYDANRGESMPIMLWRCSEHLVRSGMVGNVCHLLYDLLYVGNVCHLLYEYWRNLQRQFVLTLLNNQYSIVHPRFVFFEISSVPDHSPDHPNEYFTVCSKKKDKQTRSSVYFDGQQEIFSTLMVK